MANIIEITDFEAPELDVFTRLTENQLLNRHEPEKGIFIAESPKVIERALAAGCRPAAFLAEKGRVRGETWEIVERFPELPVFTAEFEVLSKMTGYNLTRGMLCAMYRPAPKTIEEVAQGARRLAILENVVNPTNVGAIFRSAAALNIDAVILTPDCSNPLYRRAIRVSMGTVFQIPWAFVDKELSWPEEGVKKLKSLGFRTAALALSDDSVSIDDRSSVFRTMKMPVTDLLRSVLIRLALTALRRGMAFSPLSSRVSRSIAPSSVRDAVVSLIFADRTLKS